MNKPLKILGWIIFAGLCISIGLYPLIYFMVDPKFGLLGSKAPELLTNQLWNLGFYGHITFGGIALLSGWSQFINRIRNTYPAMHRRMGMLYVITVLVSGVCGIYIGFFATGGIISSSGFILLGILWLASTLKAFLEIKKQHIQAHRRFMIYSYALCFAAVTLRLWLPALTSVFGSFIPAYRLVAWLCWVPNLLIAHIWIRRNLETA